MTVCCVLGTFSTQKLQYPTLSISPVFTMGDTSSTTTTELTFRFLRGILITHGYTYVKWKFTVTLVHSCASLPKGYCRKHEINHLKWITLSSIFYCIYKFIKNMLPIYLRNFVIIVSPTVFIFHITDFIVVCLLFCFIKNNFPLLWFSCKSFDFESIWICQTSAIKIICGSFKTKGFASNLISREDDVKIKKISTYVPIENVSNKSAK